MIQEFYAASNLLRRALERYLRACFALQNCLAAGSKNIPHELSERVKDELLQITSYETTIKKAKSAIGVFRNSVAPINALPSEVLANILELVISRQPRVIDVQRLTENSFPKYPDLLLHVCSHWRHILLGSRGLWSHIELVPCHSLSRRLLARAAFRAAQTEHSPLDVTINVPGRQIQAENTCVIEFFNSVAARTRSLELVFENRPRDFDYSLSIIQRCLLKCVPGTLTQLTITLIEDGHFPTSKFIESASNPDNAASLLLDLPRQFLEDLLFHVTVLRLHGIYPYWSSRAYHGLVELYLTCEDPDISISEPQLVGILSASPRLRVLRFDLEITNPLPLNAPIMPMYLEELSELTFSTPEANQLATFIRWIAPGSTPLQLSVSDLILAYELKEFLMRSNVTKLSIAHVHAVHPSVTELFGTFRHLQVLALSRIALGIGTGLPFQYPDECNDLAPFRLDTLYFLKCFVDDLNWIRWVLERCSVQTLVFWNCKSQNYGIGWMGVLDEQAVCNELSPVCSSIQFLDGDEPSPIEHWELL